MKKEQELFKNTVIITFGRICTQLVSFFLLPLYTTILSTEEYGIVDLVITYSSLFLPFVTLALEQALFRFLIDVRANKEKCAKYISTVFFFSLISTSLITIVLYVIYYFANNSLLLYFCLVLVGSIISAITLQISRGLGDNLGYTLGSTISAIVNIVCNVIFLVNFKFGAAGMMLASFVGNSICGIVLYFKCNLKNYIHVHNVEKNIFIELIKYSIPLIPTQLSWWALNASDKVIVQLFIGIAGNGLIAVANKFSNMYIQFSNIFNISWTESVTLHIHDYDANQFISKTINMVYRLFLCACCEILVLMPFVFPIMIHSKYEQAYNLIPIFMLASLFNILVSLYGVIYVAYKKTFEIAKTALYAASLNIISHLLLIHFIGIYASAISTAFGYGTMAVYRYFHSRKYLTIKLNHFNKLLSIVMLTLSIFSYYSRNYAFQMVTLILISLICVIGNKNFLQTMYATIKLKILRNKRI